MDFTAEHAKIKATKTNIGIHGIPKAEQVDQFLASLKVLISKKFYGARLELGNSIYLAIEGKLKVILIQKGKSFSRETFSGWCECPAVKELSNEQQRDEVYYTMHNILTSATKSSGAAKEAFGQERLATPAAETELDVPVSFVTRVEPPRTPPANTSPFLGFIPNYQVSNVHARGSEPEFQEAALAFRVTNTGLHPFQFIFNNYNAPAPYRGVDGRALFYITSEPYNGYCLTACSHDTDDVAFLKFHLCKRGEPAIENLAKLDPQDITKAQNFCLCILLEEGLITDEIANQAGYDRTNEGVALARKQISNMKKDAEAAASTARPRRFTDLAAPVPGLRPIPKIRAAAPPLAPFQFVPEPFQEDNSRRAWEGITKAALLTFRGSANCEPHFSELFRGQLFPIVDHDKRFIMSADRGKTLLVARGGHVAPDNIFYVMLDIVDGDEYSRFDDEGITPEERELAKNYCLWLLQKERLIDGKTLDEAGYDPHSEGANIASRQNEDAKQPEYYPPAQWRR